MYLRTGLRRAPSRFESEDFKNKLMRTDIIEDIRAQLFELQDKNYREFHARLMPNIEKDRIIGIRVPVLRKYAKELARGSRLFLSVKSEKRVCNTVKENDCDNVEKFLNSLPHYYYEENNLHMFLIMQMKDYDTALAYLEAFLPYIDNWATCDSGVPAVFKKHKKELLLHVYEWLDSDKPYTVRYGIGTLMRLYLNEDFDIKYALDVAKIRSEEYYVNMMKAWYIATALAKQYDAVLPILQERLMDSWSHNKAIQKARESYRITPQQKEYLNTLKVLSD